MHAAHVLRRIVRGCTLCVRADGAWVRGRGGEVRPVQIVAAVLSDPQLAELLLGADGRGASPREARAAVDDVLGGKSSVNKRELAEAMAQRASEQSSPMRGQYASPMRGQYASSSPAERARAAAEAKDRAARAFERMDKRGAGELSKEEVCARAGGCGWGRASARSEAPISVRGACDRAGGALGEVGACAVVRVRVKKAGVCCLHGGGAAIGGHVAVLLWHVAARL